MTLSVRRHDDGRIEIFGAEHYELISCELLEELRNNESPFGIVDGDRVIFADHFGNRFVYRIGDERWGTHSFELTRVDDEKG